MPLLRRFHPLFLLLCGAALVATWTVVVYRLGEIAGARMVQRAERTAGRTPAVQAIDWAGVSDDDLILAAIFQTARDAGVRAAMDSLEAVAARRPALRDRGHEIVHLLGQFAFARRKDPAVLAECRPTFQAGCYHGVLQAYFATGPAVDSASVSGICPGAIGHDAAPLVRRECAHGLGHGLFGYYRARVREALSACDYLPAGPTREECHRGAFMERMNARTTGAGHAHQGDAAHAHGAAGAEEHAAPSDTGAGARDPTSWCADVPDAYQGSCWWYVPQIVVAETPDGPEAPAAGLACERAPAGVRDTCYRGVGNMYAGTATEAPGRTREWCAALRAEARSQCVAGAAEQYVDNDWSGEVALGFCSRVRGAYRGVCYEALAARLALAQPELSAAERFCRRVGTEYAADCRRAWQAAIASAAPRG